MTAPDRVLERVRKLLATAEHPNTPPREAEAMSEKAAELMARYAIDVALLDATRTDASAPERRTLMVHAPYAMPKAVLLGQVAGPFGVRTIIGGEANGGRSCVLVGYTADAELVELLFTSLLLQATTAMLRASADQPRVRSFRHAFLLGYANVIGQRIAAAQLRAEADASTGSAGMSTELVLKERRARVDRAVEELYPRLRSLRPSVSSRGGLVAGHDAAMRADIGVGGRVGAARRATGIG